MASEKARQAQRVEDPLKRIQRTAGLSLFCTFWVMCLCSCSAGFEAEPLVEYSTDVVITGSRQLTVTRYLDAGVYLLEVRERDIDLRVVVEAPDRRSELGDACLRHGLFRKVVWLDRPGPVRVVLDSTDVRSWKGAAAVRILRWPAAGADAAPDQRLLGFEELGVGQELMSGGTPDSWRSALEPMREAARHFLAARDLQSTAEAEYLRGHLERDLLFDFTAGRHSAESALTHFQSAGDAVGARRAAVLLARAEFALAADMGPDVPAAEQKAMLDTAAARVDDAREYFEQHEMHSDALDALDQSRTRERLLGRGESSAQVYESMRRRAQARGDRYFEVIATQNLAQITQRKGDVVRAAALYESVLPAIERVRNPDLYATLLGQYGSALIPLGDFDRARSMHTEALQVFTVRGDERHMAHELTELASIQFHSGNLERALATVENALPLYGKSSDPAEHASALRLAGNTAAALGRHDLAIGYLNDAVRLDRNGVTLDRTRVLLAGELRTLGDIESATAMVDRVLLTRNESTRADALMERARLRQDQNRPIEALEDLRTADDIYARLKLEYNRIDSSSSLALALIDSGKLDEARAAAQVAVAMESRIRAKAAIPEMRARFLAASYTPYEASIEVDMAAAPGDRMAVWRAFRTADAIRARALIDRLLQGEPSPGQFAIAESRSTVQAALPEDTAVLAYFVGDRRSHAWLLTRGELRHTTLPGRRVLETFVANFIERQRSGQAAGTVNFPALLGDLLGGVNARRLIVLPDGPLHGLPFAAVPIPGGRPGELLVDRFAIASAPSLALALRAPMPRNSMETRVAVVSDPVYTPDDRRLMAAASPASQFRGVGSERLARLPYSAIEAQAVTRAFAGADIIQLAGFDATVPRVVGLPSRDLSVLHFATHAEARRDAPEQSALFLSEYAQDGSPLPVDRLTADDIRRSGLRADIVVLSGCATGDGRELRGEGVLGLTYGFLANGSDTVVASLWPVEDALTARFMQEFYSAYRATNRAADALRTAQLRTRATSGPSVWASFIVRSGALQ